MKLIKDGNIIESTKKAYDVIYKEKGYIPYEDKVDEYSYDSITVSQIKEGLDYREIEYDSKMKKQELFDLLGSDM